MAENRAVSSLRRRRSLGFSKCRLARAAFKVPSRSTLFFKRRRALSTASPFLSLISVKLVTSSPITSGKRSSWTPFSRLGQPQSIFLAVPKSNEKKSKNRQHHHSSSHNRNICDTQSSRRCYKR